jgi:hypothetical protein
MCVLALLLLQRCTKRAYSPLVRLPRNTPKSLARRRPPRISLYARLLAHWDLLVGLVVGFAMVAILVGAHVPVGDFALSCSPGCALVDCRSRGAYWLGSGRFRVNVGGVVAHRAAGWALPPGGIVRVGIGEIIVAARLSIRDIRARALAQKLGGHEGGRNLVGLDRTRHGFVRAIEGS